MIDKKTGSLSLVIPVFNEKDLIADSIKNCYESLVRDFEDFELILVDDGSIDGTGEAMESLARDNNRIRVIHNGRNLNVGVSIIRAFEISSKGYLVHNAADLPLNPKDIPRLIRDLAVDCDVLVLERERYEGSTLWRKITSGINRLLIHMLFPIASRGIRDMNFTQIYRREAFGPIAPLSRSPAFTTPEMILRARYKGLNIRTATVYYSPRSKGKGAFGKPRDILWSLYDMLRFRLKSWRGL